FDGAWTSMNADASQVLIDFEDGPAELRSFPELQPIDTFNIYPGSSSRLLSPDGQTIVYRTDNSIDIRPGFWDVATNQQISWGDGFQGFYVNGAESFLSNGYVLTPSTDSDHIYDPTTGRSLLELPTEFTIGTSVTQDDQFAATSHADGVRIWEIGERTDSFSLESTEAEIIWLNPDMVEEGPHIGLWGLIQGFDVRLAVLDPSTKDTIAFRDVVTEGDQLPDGRFVFNSQIVGSEYPSDYVAGPLEIWDPVSGESVILQDCSITLGDALLDAPLLRQNWRGQLCPEGDPYFGLSAAASSDGRFVASVSADPAKAPANEEELNRRVLIRIWDTESGAVVATHELTLNDGLGIRNLTYFGDGWLALIDGFPGTFENNSFTIIDTISGTVIARVTNEVSWRESMEVSPDESRAYFVTEQGVVYEYDTNTWQALRSWQAVDARPRGIALSPDGTLLAAGGEDERITIWALDPEGSEPGLIDRIPLAAWASDAVWVAPTRLGVVALKPYAGIEWREIELNPSLAIESARRRLLRTFTQDECDFYGISSCQQG
ncbi:MAG: WD40 repeat domain-containing protein, partial [Acidimicrobiia bacterium]